MGGGIFSEADDPDDAADRARGRNDRDTTHLDKDGKLKLASFVTRVERLESEKQTYVDDIKSVYAEAKAAGYDVKTMRNLVRRRKKDPAKLAEEDTLLELYSGVFG